MLKKALIWGGLFFLIILGTALSDRFGWHLPWYMIFLLTVLLIPNILFIRYALTRNQTKRMVVLAQIAVASIFMFISEITAIQYKFWNFLEDKDVLCGLYMGGVPFEEFFFYPLMLNISLYAYLMAKSAFKKDRTSVPGPQISGAASITLLVVAALFVGLAVYIGINYSSEIGPYFFGRDGRGLPLYTEGGRYRGWGVTVFAGMAISLAVFVWGTRRYMDIRALVFAGFTIYLASLCIELLGIGRGWWVYNDYQLLGFKIYILPLESLFMYLIGVIFPAGVYETLRIYIQKKA